MGKIRWQAKRYNIVEVVILDELVRMVGAVAIDDQEAIFATCRLPRIAIKMLDLIEDKEIVRVPCWTNTDGYIKV